MQDRVGQNHVQLPAGPPIAKVGDLKIDVAYALARRLDYVRRAVDADDERFRITFAQNLGGVTRAASDVGGARDARERNSRYEITNRPGAFLFELDVLSG